MEWNHREWLLYLQRMGVKFEVRKGNGEWVTLSYCSFHRAVDNYRIPRQDISKLAYCVDTCKEMKNKGVKFEMWSIDDKSWELIDRELSFSLSANLYRISAQPIPPWTEENKEETKEEEISHREERCQWHEDMAHFYRTGEMTEWQFRRKTSENENEWMRVDVPTWSLNCEYRRKPKIRKISYWHCLYENNGCFYTYAPLLEVHENKESVIQAIEAFESGNKAIACYEQVVEIEDKK